MLNSRCKSLVFFFLFGLYINQTASLKGNQVLLEKIQELLPLEFHQVKGSAQTKRPLNSTQPNSPPKRAPKRARAELSTAVGKVAGPDEGDNGIESDAVDEQDENRGDRMVEDDNDDRMLEDSDGNAMGENSRMFTGELGFRMIEQSQGEQESDDMQSSEDEVEYEVEAILDQKWFPKEVCKVFF